MKRIVRALAGLTLLAGLVAPAVIAAVPAQAVSCSGVGYLRDYGGTGWTASLPAGGTIFAGEHVIGVSGSGAWRTCYSGDLTIRLWADTNYCFDSNTSNQIIVEPCANISSQHFTKSGDEYKSKHTGTLIRGDGSNVDFVLGGNLSPHLDFETTAIKS
jgi:hypothetical protein